MLFVINVVLFIFCLTLTSNISFKFLPDFLKQLFLKDKGAKVIIKNKLKILLSFFFWSKT